MHPGKLHATPGTDLAEPGVQMFDPSVTEAPSWPIVCGCLWAHLPMGNYHGDQKKHQLGYGSSITLVTYYVYIYIYIST